MRAAWPNKNNTYLNEKNCNITKSTSLRQCVHGGKAFLTLLFYSLKSFLQTLVTYRKCSRYDLFGGTRPKQVFGFVFLTVECDVYACSE